MSRRYGRARRPATPTTQLNDIHALLTSQDTTGAALTDIALILARTGRPMVAARDIEVTTTETVLGWPVACVQSGDASVVIGQAPAGPGLLVEIATKSAAERDALRVTLDGLTLHPPSARPSGGPQPVLHPRKEQSHVSPEGPRPRHPARGQAARWR